MKPTIDTVRGTPPRTNPVSERTQLSLDRVGQFIADITTVAREHNRLDSELVAMRRERDQALANVDKLRADAARMQRLIAWAAAQARVRATTGPLTEGFRDAATEYGQAGGCAQRALYVTVHTGPVLYQPSDDVECGYDSYFIDAKWHTPDDPDTAIFVLCPLPENPT